MNIENDVIETLEQLENFLIQVESGALGLKDVAGIALATSNSDGRPFVAVLSDKHELLLGRWVSKDVYENGKELVRTGPKRN
ncbi:hypothetical protein [Vibrio barjaei]|jgi:hypothetical protein|uniref:Uncharacterized protein n=1 Tax=Vibrio barjaei TaxID=1676683 RepID=A0ABW7INX9_9VIBR|nr:hypothetical protein [Vibrio barjaei]MCG9789405.1 hypothetical protein [Vibrio mediterranei]MCY9871750.1 hypothetical protein [Vibrio barjaei]OIN26907.1 hypothetical protein AWH66_2000755 [Vibrio barjaei]